MKNCTTCKNVVIRKHEISNKPYYICSNWMGSGTIFPLSSIEPCGRYIGGK